MTANWVPAVPDRGRLETPLSSPAGESARAAAGYLMGRLDPSPHSTVAPEGNSVRLVTIGPMSQLELASPEVRVEMHGNQMHTDALHNQLDEHVEGSRPTFGSLKSSWRTLSSH